MTDPLHPRIMKSMSSWRTLLAAALVVTFAAACNSKPVKKSSSDDEDDDEPVSKTAQSSSSASASSSSETAAADVPVESTAKPPADSPEDALLLDGGKHRVSVIVKPDGRTEIRAFNAKEDEPLDGSKVKGKVKPGEGEWVDLKGEDKFAVAQIPELQEGLTTVNLALEIDGDKFEESVDVPQGGTKALSEKPKKTIPPGTKGPNGGMVEVVDDQIVEVVIDEKTDDVRVYFLNDKLEVMEVPPGTEITLNIETEDKKK